MSPNAPEHNQTLSETVVASRGSAPTMPNGVWPPAPNWLRPEALQQYQLSLYANYNWLLYQEYWKNYLMRMRENGEKKD
jgi:hypothetical protein